MTNTTKGPGLNADARAVLLAAHLPAEDVPGACIIVRDDLRRPQFERGHARLRAAGLVDGDTYNLTDAGLRLARRLQENEAALEAGIPYAARGEAIRLRGGTDTAKVPDEWQRCEIDGQPAFTNGYILCLGIPPSDGRLKQTFRPENIQKAWTLAGEDAPQVVVPAAYSEEKGWKDRRRRVWLSDGACVDAEAFNFVMRRAPGSLLTHETAADAGGRRQRKVLNFYVDGHRVAMLMPYQLDAPEGVAAVLKAGAEVERREAAKVIPHANADRAARGGRFVCGMLAGKADSIEADYRFYLHADRLAAAVGRGKFADMLDALREKPAHCLTWLLLCWKGADAELLTCTGRSRASWLRMIEGEAEPEGVERAAVKQATSPLPSHDGGRASQLSLTFLGEAA